MILALFLPLFGFLFLLLTNRVIGKKWAGYIGCGTVFCSFITFVTLLLQNEGPEVVTLFDWIHVGPVNADFTLTLDHLSLLMALIITGVGFLIHVYSIGYMEHEEDVVRYFACMNFFVFSMLLLVLAGDLLVLFIGWEGVGLASYLLIGFWYDQKKAAQAATKAFVINRIGDLGFLLGLLLTYTLFGTSDIGQVTKLAVAGPMLTLLTLLLFIGAVGKSAQLPLYTWLPDAMAGPTPVSALIHAATMVTAGVYLVVRMHEVYLLAPITLQVIGVVGGVTSLYASLCAFGQTDLKRVLAYSTVSQLGLMFLACGIGAFYSAMFHLTAHAFVKALLFLSAGNVVHMMHGETEMEQMGGLSKIFKKTHWLFLIGALALAGIPPLVTFFSKDLILEEEILTGHDILYFIALAASILTGVYLMRAYCLTFKGYGQPQASEIKEAPGIMLTPVTILAFLSIFGGFLGYSASTLPPLEDFLQMIGLTSFELELSHGFHFSLDLAFAILGSIAGVIITYFIYTRYRDSLGRNFSLLRNSFYVDEIYWKGIAVPFRALAELIANFFEPRVIEGSMQMTGRGTGFIAKEVQRVQSGQIRSYVAWMALGIVCLIVLWVF